MDSLKDDRPDHMHKALMVILWKCCQSLQCASCRVVWFTVLNAFSPYPSNTALQCRAAKNPRTQLSVLVNSHLHCDGKCSTVMRYERSVGKQSDVVLSPKVLWSPQRRVNAFILPCPLLILRPASSFRVLFRQSQIALSISTFANVASNTLEGIWTRYKLQSL